MATAESDLTIPLDRIKGDPHNVRTRVNVNSIKGLADSIKGVGLLNPIIVRPFEDGYQVIAGHRRLAAIGMLVDAGDHDGAVPVILRGEELTEADVTVEQLVENLQREDIDVLDEANGFARLLEFDMSQADIARKVGRSRAHITKRLALLSLPVPAQDRLRKGDITIEHALAIAALDDDDQATYVEQNNWDEYTVQRLLRNQKGKKAAAKAADELAGLGVKVFDPQGVPTAEWEAPEGFRFTTTDSVWTDQWDGAIPEGAVRATITPKGDTANVHFYELAEVDTKAQSKAEKAEAKATEAEKERRKTERLAERSKTDFLTSALAKVKAADANEIAMSMALDRVGYANAKEICTLLDLDVPVKEETTYDGKTRTVKQYGPLILSMVKEAREAGDIGFLRRVVLACAVGYGYRDDLLGRYGYDPDPE